MERLESTRPSTGDKRQAAVVNKNTEPLADSVLAAALEALHSNSEIIDIIMDILLLMQSGRQVSLIQRLILDFNIPINEKLVSKVERALGIGGGRGGSAGNRLLTLAVGDEQRELLTTLADTALQQSEYVMAAKLYNGLGDRLNSMKALIRSGQTQKIINYANVARDKTVYRLAVNYLQTINHEDEKLIATFQKKSGKWTVVTFDKMRIVKVINSEWRLKLSRDSI